MPGPTLQATMDHAEIRPTLKEGIKDAKRLPRILAEAGVDYRDVTETLENEGVVRASRSSWTRSTNCSMRCARRAAS